MVATVDPLDHQPDRGEVPSGFDLEKVAMDGAEFWVAVADTNEQRELGLMGVTDMGGLAGMLFDFGQETRGGFWMKDTLIPLDIGFFNADGLLVAKLTMAPCEADPCEIYWSPEPFSMALETPAGRIGEWKVGATTLTVFSE